MSLTSVNIICRRSQLPVRKTYHPRWLGLHASVLGSHMASLPRPCGTVAWIVAALQFGHLHCSAHGGSAPQRLAPLRGPVAAHRAASETSFLLDLGLCSLSVVLTKLTSFSPEAPRPTASNADQDAQDKKKGWLWAWLPLLALSAAARASDLPKQFKQPGRGPKNLRCGQNLAFGASAEQPGLGI